MSDSRLGIPLTPREVQVGSMIAEGLQSKEIAFAIGLQLSTVEAHRWNLMRKLGVHNAAQLVRALPGADNLGKELAALDEELRPWLAKFERASYLRRRLRRAS